MTANSNLPRLVIAGTESGVGKTTIATGVMAALKKRGMRVQPFKVGPDYIDPTYHTLATGVPSRNLDSWMLTHQAISELFARAAQKADICIIEGVMGLYDGHSGLDDSGSTAEVAKLLHAPVILIIDAGRMARSAAAISLGYVKYDHSLNIAGFIVNNIGSERHLAWVREAIENATSIPVAGYLPKNADFEMPERHLGLIPTVENAEIKFIEPLCTQIEQTFDIDRLLEIARSAQDAPIKPSESLLFPSEPVAPKVNLAYAWDEAFSFYYQDNLDLLEAYGARLIPFSPLNDFALPPDTHGIYIGGGFPEVYAERLSANQAIMDSIRKAASQDMPIYGECGGLMYLAKGITDFEGNRYRMAGLVPAWLEMKKRLVRMGYVEIEFEQDTILGPRGMKLRGHEFHWSDIEADLSPPACRVTHPDERFEGYSSGNIMASYIHLHFGTDASLARNFIEACRQLT